MADLDRIMTPERATGPVSSPDTAHGFGRLLVAVYGLFALAATARAVFQLVTKAQHAPLAYWLSAFAGCVYIVATLALGVGGRKGWRIAALAVCIEVVGVLAVGTWSLVSPASFPDASVWSDYGEGYGFVPLVLPFAGLVWLWRTRPRRATGPHHPAST